MSGVIRWVFVCICGVWVGTECLVSPDGSLYVCVRYGFGLNAGVYVVILEI